MTQKSIVIKSALDARQAAYFVQTASKFEAEIHVSVDEKKIKSAGVSGVIRPGKNSVQVVVGTKVQFVADEFKKLCK